MNNDSIFVERGRQLLIFLSKGFYCSNNNNNYKEDGDYYVLQCCQEFPKEELGLVGNIDLQNHFDSLRVIQKAVNFLRRKLDRFRYRKFYAELSKLIKILGIGKNEYGVQDDCRNFVIWKKRKNGRWRKYEEYWKD
jgi:hypothetical protein